MDASGVNGSKRLVVVTPGNLRQSHFYIHEHLDFFPKDCIGPSRKTATRRGVLLTPTYTISGSPSSVR